MHFLYSLIINIYGFLLQIASNFNLKAKKWIAGRKSWKAYLSKKIILGEKYCWIHCASAGEFEQAIPLIEKIKDKRRKTKDYKIAVSFFSPSGFEMYKDSKFADIFFYFPLDTKKNVQQLIDILKPSFTIFIRNEIWLNTLSILKEKEIPAFLVNANLGQKRNFIYKKYLRKTYPLFTKIFDTKTFGNTKLERVSENSNEIFNDAILEEFCKNSFIIILGSSWQEEEKLMAEFYSKSKTKFPNLKIIIAPHEYDANKEKELENLFAEKVISYSSLNIQHSQFSILFLDKKGILKYAYKYANIAVIGGGYGKGVHNISEASVYGIPTIFGPNYHKFEEVQELLELQAAFSINNYEKFEKTLLELIEKITSQKVINNKLYSYFSEQKKVSEKIMNEIFSYLNH